MAEERTKEQEDALLKKYIDESTPIHQARSVGSVIGWYFVGNTPEWKKLMEESDRLSRDNLTATKEELDTYYALEGKAVRDGHATIRQLGITGITYEPEGADKATVTITLDRPGLIIGAKGSTIDAITKELCSYFKREVRVRLIEDKVVNSLYVYIPEDDPMDYGTGEDW